MVNPFPFVPGGTGGALPKPYKITSIGQLVYMSLTKLSYAVCNIIQLDWFGGWSVMVWGGVSLEGCTELLVIANVAIRLRTRTYIGAVSPAFLLVQGHCWTFCGQSV